MNEEWFNFRFEVGDRVTSIDPLPPPATDWAPEAITWRAPGVSGTIVKIHDAHGLCYRVQYDDGRQCCYEPHELVTNATKEELQQMLMLVSRKLKYIYHFLSGERSFPSQGEPVSPLAAQIDTCLRGRYENVSWLPDHQDIT